MEGWIKLHKRFLDWEWFDEDGMVKLFITLLLMANYEDKKWHGGVILRGQVITSRDKLAAKVRMSVRSLRTCLSRLEQTGEIEIKTTNKYTVITISNYDKYQVVEDDERPTSDQQPTNNRPTNDQQPTTTKEIKEIYNNLSQNAGAYAHVREGSYPAENWRFLSSARKFSLGNNPDAIADYKKELIAEELSLVAAEIKMPQDAQEKFLAKWCEHNPGSDKIKADYEATFNIRDRAIQFMGWWNRNGDRQYQAAAQQPKSRSDKFEEEMNKIDAFFDGFYGNRQQTSSVDEQ